MIFASIQDRTKPRANSQDLLHAALTSKDFLNPALNVLWRSLPSLLPILNLIPSFEVIANERDDNRPYYVRDDAVPLLARSFQFIIRRQPARILQRAIWHEWTYIQDVSGTSLCVITRVQMSNSGLRATSISLYTSFADSGSSPLSKASLRQH